jgi:PAS domain-containing protein
MDIKSSEEKEDLNKGLRRTEAGDNKRGEALQAVLEKEETLKTIINNSQVVLFLWKNEDKWPVEFVSENVANFGYTVEDLTSGRVLYKDIIYPDDLENVQDVFEKKIRSGSPEFIIEYRICNYSA